MKQLKPISTKLVKMIHRVSDEKFVFFPVNKSLSWLKIKHWDKFINCYISYYKKKKKNWTGLKLFRILDQPTFYFHQHYQMTLKGVTALY